MDNETLQAIGYVLVELPFSIFCAAVVILGTGLVREPEDRSVVFRLALRTRCVPGNSVVRIVLGVAGLMLANAVQVMYLADGRSGAAWVVVLIYFVVLAVVLGVWMATLVRGTSHAGVPRIRRRGKRNHRRERQSPDRQRAASIDHVDAPVVASMKRRVAAWLLDFGGLYVMMLIVAIAFNLGHVETSEFVRANGEKVAVGHWTVGGDWTGSLVALLSGAYCFFMWQFTGATLGQRALGLRVVDRARSGRIGPRRAIARWFGLFGWTSFAVASGITNISPPFALAALVWIVALLVTTARSEERQGFHDRLGRTLVVVSRR